MPSDDATSKAGTDQDWMNRTSYHVHTCRQCGADVRVVAELEPDEHGSKRNAGLKLACGCLTMSFDDIPEELPPNWEVDLDFEVMDRARSI